MNDIWVAICKAMIIIALVLGVTAGLYGALAIGLGIDQANEMTTCWGEDDQYLVTRISWEDQRWGQMTHVVTDRTVLTSGVVTMDAADMDGKQNTYWAYKYDIEQEQGVTCWHTGPQSASSNAALWNELDWVLYCTLSLVGFLSVLALSAVGFKIAEAACDEHDWDGLGAVCVLLLGIVWPIGFLAGIFAGTLWLLKQMMLGAIKVGCWAGEL